MKDDPKDKLDADKANQREDEIHRAHEAKIALLAKAEGASEADRRTSNNSVFIGCKLPHGIVLQLTEVAKSDRGDLVHVFNGEPITLKGQNSSSVIGGYGITEVPEDFWNEWLRQNSKLKAVRSGLIFAQPKRKEAMAQAADSETLKTGTEALDPDKPAKGIIPVPKSELKDTRG